MKTLFIQIFEDIMDQIEADGFLHKVQARFESSEDVHTKALIIDDILKRYYRRPEIQYRQDKSSEKSAELRHLGNRHFATGDYLKALKLYNESICYAENDSKELSIAFANRSAVYFSLGLYDDCLKNIELAKTDTLPASVTEKVDERKTLCLEQLKDKVQRPVADIKLSFPANPNVPFISNCLQLQKNAQYGRHVITTSDLKAGDIVAVEKSFCSTLPEDLQYMRCENCLLENNQSLIPCKHCTSVMFCGDECCEAAYIKFHKFECPIIDFIKKMFVDNPLINLRTGICAITTFNSIDELIEFVDETEGQDLTVFDCNFANKSRNAYGPVHFLKEEIVSSSDEFVFMIWAAMIYQPLLEYTELGEMFTTTKHIQAVKELFIRCVKQHKTNKSESALMMDDFPNGKHFSRPDKPFARSIHPLRNMFSHSCAPNVICSSFGRELVFTISRPIKAGEQLFDTYGCVFTTETFIERRERIQHFLFKCECVACENRYPLYDELTKGTIPAFESHKIKPSELLQSCADYINKYANHYPCHEMVQAECNLRFFTDSVYAGPSMEQRSEYSAF